MELEKKVLEGIIEMLDEQEGEKLKKHPKLMAMQIEVGKPKMDKEEMGEPKEDSMADMKEDAMEDEEELSPEMIQKLLEMVK